jgi:geranylgeranyl diphosphate synthase type II
LLAGASADQQLKLEQIGVLAGIGFQLKDDLLDVYGDPDKVGKQVGGDILADKKTYLLISALNSNRAAEVRAWFGNKQEKDKVDAVKAIYSELGLERKSQELIQSYFDQAFSLIDELEGDTASVRELRDLLHYLIEREN